MVDRYFERPLFYDYTVALLLCGIFYFLKYKGMISLPTDETSLSTTTDLSTISLTLAGFVLTLLTVLVTFKTGARIPNGQNNEDVPLFDLFFSTSLYYKTTALLKNCIKSLVFVSILGFSLKLFLTGVLVQYLFFSNILGLIIIVTTLARSIMILTKIIDLQKDT